MLIGDLVIGTIRAQMKLPPAVMALDVAYYNFISRKINSPVL